MFTRGREEIVCSEKEKDERGKKGDGDASPTEATRARMSEGQVFFSRPSLRERERERRKEPQGIALFFSIETVLGVCGEES